jgi:hypothetical protein
MTDERRANSERRAVELAGLAGILSFPLGLAGVIVGQMWAFPGTGATASEIASFVAGHRSALLTGMALEVRVG